MKEKAIHLVKGVKSVTDFLSDAVDAFKEVSFVEAIEKALPWAKVAGEATAEALPPLKFITTIAEELLKETDPEKLGLTACTLAYQNAVEIAFKRVGSPKGERQSIKDAKEQLRELNHIEDIDMGTFSLEAPQQHEFYTQAKLCLEVTAIKVGYTQGQVEEVTEIVQENFRHSLMKLLSDGETADKFKPFTEYLNLGGADEKRARKLLAQHANYQRWLFEQAPVLRVSPFALKHVYIETDCGKLRWEEINQPQHVHDSKMRPFSEEHGGRQPLLETVLELIGSKDLTEAIIIQGFAGAGKSSFTLKLCDELLKRRLHPIRVRIKDLSFDKHIKDALPKAVLFGDEDYPEPEPFAFDNLFLGDAIFRERGIGQYEHICKYVLILDGWDEISLSDEGFKKKVAQMLDQINDHYLKQKNPRIRIILTGRPTSDIGDTNCLRDKTPFLTIRKLRPDQLQEYVGRLAAAVNSPEPLIKRNEQTETWAVPELGRFEPIFKKYEQTFEKEKQKATGELDVLGLPLLTYLTVRLVAEWHGDLTPLLEDTTTLYRHLIDLTCKEAGKGQVGREDGGDQYKIYDLELRQLLWQTAAAITMSGEENISRKELASRLDLEEEEIDKRTGELARESKLSALLISFYFKGGHSNLGCEFAHKSFREYLFAEAIVEALKDFGRRQRHTPPPRTSYWEDFREDKADDFRFGFSRRMSELLSPQWLTDEVRNHIQRLIAWEIERTVKSDDGVKRPGVQTQRLNWEEWKQIRTGIADLWEWWGEGAHLRPQSYKVKGVSKIEPAYVNELIEWDAPRDARISSWGYARTTTMDAHLGEGLFHLCVQIHAYMAENEQEEGPRNPPILREYQSAGIVNERRTILFKPSGGHPGYFRNYIARINSAGWRLRTFPSVTDMRLTDFEGIELADAVLDSANLSEANLSFVQLAFASLYFTNFEDANLNGAELIRATLQGAYFANAKLREAKLNGADFSYSTCTGADLTNATLTGANMRAANFDHAMFTEESFRYSPDKYDLLAQFKETRFNFIYLGQEKLDRETALQRIREIQEKVAQVESEVVESPEA